MSGDCPTDTSQVPPLRQQKSAARAEYDILLESPYKYTSDDVIYETRGKPKGTGRAEFFSSGKACFRASALVKRYGWGVHSDEDGNIAIFAMESDEYKRFAADPNLKHLKGMNLKKSNSK